MWRMKETTSLARGYKKGGNALCAWNKMMTRHGVSSWISAFLVLAPFIVPAFAEAALPFTVKPSHPRVYLDRTRVATIQTAASAPIPLNKTAFPQSQGTVLFDIKPTLNPGIALTGCGGTWVCKPVFDDYDGTRNHLFVREAIDTANPPPPGYSRYQFTLQKANPNAYVAVANINLLADQWHSVRISWNSTAHTALLQIDGVTQGSFAWLSSGQPYEWMPSEQSFVLRGRDQLDNVRVFNTDVPGDAGLVADFPMSEGTGRMTSDASGHGIKALLGAGVSWTAGPTGGADHAVQFDGQSSTQMRIKPDSILTDAWQPTYGLAVQYATSLNNNVSPVNLNTGHQDSIAQVAHVIGLAWLVTGEDRFRTAGLKYADLLMAVPVMDGNEYSQAGRVAAMGIIYDWFFDVVSSTSYEVALAEAVKQTLTATSTSTTGTMLGSMICGSGRYVDPTSLACNGSPTPTIQPYYIGGHAHIDNHKTAMALLAMFDLHPEFENLLAAVNYNFINGFEPARAWISVDGGHHMGWAYGATYTDLLPAKLWGTATDVSLLADWQGQLVYRYIYGLRGDALSFPASGDVFSYTAGAETLSAFALWSTANFADPYAQRFYEGWNLPLKGDNRLNELLFWNGDIPSSPLEGLPYSRLFHNSGQVLMRDTWDYPGATLLEFKSSSFWSENHHHLDQNAFTIYYKAPLLIDSGYYGGTDEYGSSHWQNYYTRTIAHNTLTIFDPSETFSKYGTVYSNDGGQRFIYPYYPIMSDIQSGGSNHLDGVTAYEYGDSYTYVSGNASKAYNATKLDQTNGFLRSLVFLRQSPFWPHPVTVVFDKVTSTPDKPNLVKRFLMHSVNEPEPLGGTPIAPGQYQVTGDTITIRNGYGMLFAQALLPENPVLTKVGGTDTSGDYRFMVPVKDANGNYQYQNFGLTTSASEVAKNPDVGAWRIEITAPTPTGREYFLNVLSVADNGAVSAPPTAQNLSTPDVAALLLADQKHIVFAKADQPAVSVQWNTPNAQAPSLVAGLVPDTIFVGYVVPSGSMDAPYTVALQQNAGGTLRSSSQGLLAITSALPMATDLTLTLTDTPDPVLIGDTVTYTIMVTNNGPSPATGVTASGTLSICNFGTIASGASASCTRTAAATAAGTLSQTMTVSAAEYDLNTANNTATADTTVNTSVSGGLRGDYYDNPDFTGFVSSRIDPTVNFSWSGNPITGVGADTFSVRWSGKVKPQYTQTYTFYVRSNDGARLWVNGQLLIDNWGPHGTVEDSGTIALTAGQLTDIKLEYWDNTGSAVAKLSWSSPSRSKQVIPSGLLYH
jgi:hypothetical protein